MTTETITLSSFLLARIAEDEAVAREAQSTGDGWWHDGDGEVWSHMQLVSHPTMVSHAAHIARHDPARVLAECAAKRAIVAALDMTPCPCRTASRCVIHDSSAGPPEFARERYEDPVTEFTLRALAAVYSEHEGYRDDWHD